MHDSIKPAENTILVADDNPVNIKLVRSILEKEGYHTSEATSGAACMETAREHRPDLILLDICMPNISGIETCNRLKQDKRVRDIPIIFVTANRQSDTIKTAFDAGGADYVLKPINRIELLSRIKSVLTQQILMQKSIEKEKFLGVLEMAGAVCHELNQPIQVVMGFSDLLLAQITPDHPLHTNLTCIKDQVHRMGGLTQKLMRITKYETKHYTQGVRIIDIDKAAVA